MGFFSFLVLLVIAYLLWRVTDQLPDLIFRMSEIQRDVAEIRRNQSGGSTADQPASTRSTGTGASSSTPASTDTAATGATTADSASPSDKPAGEAS